MIKYISNYEINTINLRNGSKIAEKQRFFVAYKFLVLKYGITV